MALVRWEPAREIGSLQNEMNRLFSSFFDTPSAGSGALRRWSPAMDVVETENDYILKADLPGLTEGDVNIEVENNVLTLSGERHSEHEDQQAGFYRVERAFGAFSRSLQLPEGTDPEAVSAQFDRGVLEVRVPKPEQRRPRRVAIAVGGENGKHPAEGETVEGESRDA